MDRAKRFFDSTTTQLAATYLLIIMLMSIGFSIVFYNTTSRELNRQVPPTTSLWQTFDQPNNSGQISKTPRTLIHDFLNERASEGRHELLLRLVVLNTLALVAGGAFSYYLARRTLTPIEASMEAQQQFISDASHELRTPLTVIQTGNEVALRNAKLTLEQAKDVIKNNSEEAAKLKLLSDGLLDLAKNGRTRHTLSTIKVHEPLKDALTQVVELAQAKNIAIDDTTANLAVTSHRGVLAQILVIFLDNAIKYSPEDSTIFISTTTKGSNVWLHIKDEGIGIRASDLPHIFRRFYRADTTRKSGDQNGYGLGLAIADRLATAHDISLQVESQAGHGSTFSLGMRRAK